MEKNKETFQNLLIYWLPVFSWMSLIFFFSSQSRLPGATQIIFWDFIMKKSAHMVIYGILFFLLQRAINKKSTHKKFVEALIITFFYAISDEYHQSFTTGRTALPTDVIFDMIGAIIVFMRFRKTI